MTQSEVDSITNQQPGNSAIHVVREGEHIIRFDFQPMGLSLPTGFLLLFGAVGIAVFWSRAAAFVGLHEIDADKSSIEFGVTIFSIAVMALFLGITFALGRYRISVTHDTILKRLYFVGVPVLSCPVPINTIRAIEKWVEPGRDFQIRLGKGSDDNDWVVIEGFKTEAERDWLFCYLESVLSDQTRPRDA